jgi:signal transduction histidine kinase
MSVGARRRPWSLASRLGWRLAAVMLVAILATAALVAWRTIATVRDLDDSALQNQADRVAQPLAAIPADSAHPVLPDAVVAPFRASDGDNLFLVYDGAERLVASSDPTEAGRVAAVMDPRQPDGFFRLPAMVGHEHGMLGLMKRAGSWRIAVLQGREQTALLLDTLINSFLLGAIWLLLPLGIATVAVGVLTIRRGLRPLRRVSAAASRVGPSQPGVRLPSVGLPQEAIPLVAAVNEALTRLDLALVTQRRFMAEAAHALRTPLAVLVARLDVQEPSPEHEALRRDADKMTRLVGQLLRMARLEGLPLDVSQNLDLHAAVVEAIAGLVPLALRRGVEIALSENGPVRQLAGNQAAIELAVSNLIENAIVHAPDGSTIEVVVGPPARIEVQDRGPGVPAADRDRIFQRFERGASSQEGGAGLGLAIVTEIAAAHGGSVRVNDRPGGGACFVIDLAWSRRPVGALPAEASP